MKKLRKVLAVITALALAVSMLSVVSIAEEEYEPTIYINSVTDFITFSIAEDYDRDGKIYDGVLVVLNTDIDFSEISEYYVTNFFPLFHDSSAGFGGMFEGNGHTIYNYNIDSSGSCVGLFASINGGTVKNLTITGSIVGGNKVGAIAGTVIGGTISNCASYVTVSSYYEDSWSYYIGGIVGFARESTITNCKNYGRSVDGDSEVGGIVGDVLDTTISNCVNYSNVTLHDTWGVGGIAGEIHGDSLASGCSNYGDVISVDDGGMVGGIAGKVNSGEGKGTVFNCYNCGAISGPTSVGGIAGEMTNAYQITNCINDGNVVGTGNRVGGVIGYALNLYSIENCCNNGDVTSSGSYVGGIAGRTSLDDSNSCSVSFDYIIVSDCSNTGNICGGYNYTGGIFGDAKAVIVTDCYNTGSISTTSDRGASMGGITGYLYDGSSLTNCYNEGTVTGYQLIGGVVGNSAGGNIERCYNTGSVTGEVGYMGGVVARATSWSGYHDVTSILKDSYNIGTVTCVGTGTYIGGIVGSLSCVYCENCYNAGSVIADSGNIGAAFGSANLNNSGEMLGTVSNVYYLDTSAESAVGALASNSFTSYVTAGLTSKTEEEFNSGEVTYLLNGSTSTGDLVWYQNVVTGENDVDQYPVLDDESEVVLQITVMMDDETLDVCYTNVDCILEEYPTSDSGEFVFYYEKELINEIDTATGIYSSDSIIYAAYAPVEYNVVISSVDNGTVVADVSTAAAGETVTLTVTPDEGYEVSSVIVTDEAGNEVAVADDYTFTMPENDVTVTAVFAEVVEDTAIWTVTRDEWADNGNYASFAFVLSDYCNDADEIVSGDNVTINVTVESDGTYFNGTIGVNTPNDTAEDGYSWASAGTIESTASPDVWTYTVDVASDYAQVQLWWIGSDGLYVSVTDISVTVNEIEPEPTTYAVTVSEVENGTVTADVDTAEAGDTVTLSVTPDEGYEISSVIVTDADGNEVIVADNYSFTMPENNVTVTAVFEEVADEPTEPSETYTVTVTVTVTGGTATVDRTEAAEGETVTIKITPADGYSVNGVTVVDSYGNTITLTLSGTAYTFTMPSSAVTITPTFEKTSTEHTHTYVLSSWSWSNDLNSAVGIFYCSSCGSRTVIPATITSSYINGVPTKIASIYYSGAWYSDSQIDISSLSSTTMTTIPTTTTTTTTTEETITVSDPVEDTNTKTEDEGETVSEPEVSAETNPTTGVALSLVPLAIAALAIVSSKRK